MNRPAKPRFSGLNLISFGLFLFAFVILAFFKTKAGLETSPCANSVSCIKNLTGQFEASVSMGIFHGQPVTAPRFLAEKPNLPKILGENTGANKRISVDLSNQKLYAFEGNRLVYTFNISSGKWYPTPTGDFRIWVKLRYTRMTGGNPAIHTYYDLPNVPFTMFFYSEKIGKERGFSLHGAYWHNNFGHPMSHGCINMSIGDAEKIYYWSQPTVNGTLTYASSNDLGTPITIYGSTPQE